MAGKSVIRRALLLAVFGQTILPALADDGTVLTFGLHERLGYGNNLDLSTPSTGNTARASTELSFGLVSQSALQSLSISGSTALTTERSSGQTTTDFRDPNLRFSYARTGANTAVSATGRVTRSQISTFNFGSLIDLNGDGIPDLPPDIGSLIGTGYRTDYSTSAKLDIGTNAPIGFTLDAAASGISYSASGDPSLADVRRRSIDGTTHLRFSDVTEGRVVLGYSTYDEASPFDIHRETRSVSFGINQALSATTTLDASLGYTRIVSTQPGGDTTDQGLTGSLSLRREVPDGVYDASLSSDTDINGRRLTLSVGRSLDLPNSSLSARIGATRHDNDSPVAIGSLSWSRKLPDAQINAQAVRSAITNGDGLQQVTTALRLNYSYDVNQSSGLGLHLAWINYKVQGSSDLIRTEVSASYRHALTEDWDLNLGATWRQLKQASASTERSNEVFMSLGRSFEWRP